VAECFAKYEKKNSGGNSVIPSLVTDRFNYFRDLHFFKLQKKRWVSKNLTWLFKIFKVNVTLENAKYLQINQPYILINNHQSSLDFLSIIT
jgi:1-acyl-sn-glycerol-3-phosphate acyltransferase